MMDPIFIMNSQNQRMLENTQRSSDGLRTNMMRERKEKAGVRKSHYIDDTAEFSSDLSDMGEDMLGGMDDLVGGGGGGGGAALFRKMWEEDIEEEDRKAAMRSADTLFDDGQGTCLIDAEEKTDAGIVPADESAPASQVEPPLSEANKESEQVSSPPSVKEATRGDSLGADAVIDLESGREAALKAALAREEEQVRETEAAAAAESSARAAQSASEQEVETANDKVVKISTSAQEVVVPAAEDVDLSASESKNKKGSGSSSGCSFISSLLDNSEGFIFHEAVPEVVEISGSTSKTKRETETFKVPHELEKVLDQLIVCHSSPEAGEALRILLSRFGKGVLDTCMRDGLKVELLSHKELVSRVCEADSALKERNIGYGAYLPKERVCLIAEEIFTESSSEVVYGFHPALYYFGMAWDHALGEGSFASLQSPVVKANAQACRTGLEGHCAPDPMSCADPVNYFAQAVEAYFSANDCAEALWSREDLYDFDRLMYDYLEYLHLKSGKQA
ncbi:MAG: hypothetical protein ACI38Q_05270 [Candidatus Bruticola sp.]